MSENSRRRFLKTLSLSALGAAFSPALLAGTPSSSNALSRPNILLILADDWSWPHASLYGDSVVKTPNFDRVGREGVIFNNAYCSVSSCTPSRATILSGQIFWRLGKASILGGDLPVDTPVYTDILEAAGYKTAYGGKGLAPGGAGGWDHNPAGTQDIGPVQAARRDFILSIDDFLAHLSARILPETTAYTNNRCLGITYQSKRQSQFIPESCPNLIFPLSRPSRIDHLVVRHNG